jgi:hypothetical protein
MVRDITFNFCADRQFFGGGGSVPSVPAAPPIAPAPVPTQTNATPTLEGRQQQVAMLKYGALSTVSNQGGASGIGGIAGAGPDMYPSMTPGTSGRQTTGGT